jgi:predicted RNA methylase
MGYYPTPLSVVERVRSFLKFPDTNVNLLDPCCGEGSALKNLVNGGKATTFGIELDGHRSENAKENLDHVLKCSYEDARISNRSFSGLFLNPPYDWELASSEDAINSRKEKTFLTGTVQYLQPEGVMVYIIPHKRARGDIAKILSYRFEDLQSYRFPDGEYEKFNQIVLFGRRKKVNKLDESSYEKLSLIPIETLPEIPLLDEPVYELLPSPDVKMFRSTQIDETELEKYMASSALWEKLGEYGRNNHNGTGRPPLPLHTGHLGLLLASGCLDGVVGEGKDRHVVRGKVEKMTYTDQEYEGDVLVERQTERYRVSIKILKKNGDIMTLM